MVDAVIWNFLDPRVDGLVLVVAIAISFGLLTSEECRDSLKEDPYVPRSRLAMAVPFLGKDVPSKLYIPMDPLPHVSL